MPDQTIPINHTQIASSTSRAAFTYAGSLAALFMLATALDFTRGLTVLETLQCAGIFAALALAAILYRGPVSMSQRPGGRIALAGFFAAALTSLDPVFRYTFFDSTLTLHGVVTQSAVVLPCLGALLLWAFSLNHTPEPLRPCDSAARLETFLRAPATRLNLIFVAFLAFPAIAILSGVPLRSSLAPMFIAWALLLSLNALLTLAQSPLGARVLCVAPLLALGWMIVKGSLAYLELKSETALTLEMMESKRPEEAKQAYERAVKLSKDLRTDGPRIKMESAIARTFEAQNNPGAALPHWESAADLLKADRATFAPIQRVRCELGFSLPPWRKLVYEGFPAINNAEMAPGVMRLGEIAPDVRAKLLAALLAWDQRQPETDRRRLLEAVQKAAPGEPSSMNLLNRLGVPLPDAPLWLPAELIVGSTITLHGELGTIEDLGETSTIVCLNAGHWEMSLRAAGTPLHEEWPIVRVELNGQPLATTQVNKVAEHDVPFTFDVTRNDIFRLRIVFVNKGDDLEQGRSTHRGLTISGIKFSRAKD